MSIETLRFPPFPVSRVDRPEQFDIAQAFRHDAAALIRQVAFGEAGDGWAVFNNDRGFEAYLALDPSNDWWLHNPTAVVFAYPEDVPVGVETLADFFRSVEDDPTPVNGIDPESVPVKVLFETKEAALEWLADREEYTLVSFMEAFASGLLP